MLKRLKLLYSNISLKTQLKISNKIQIKLNQIDSLLEKRPLKEKNW